jgi:hypothetical protein
VPSLRLNQLQSLVCRTTRKSSGFSRRGVFAISDVDVRFLVRPSPDSRESGSVSRAGAPLRSSFAVPPGALAERLSCRGSRPSSRHHRRCPLVAQDPNLALRSVLRLSQPLDGLLHLPASWACFIPQPRPGFSPFRDFSRIAAVLTRHQALPPCRCLPFAHRQAGCHERPIRLRGFPPRFGAFLGSGVSLPCGRFPLRLSSSFRLSAPTVSPVPRTIRS